MTISARAVHPFPPLYDSESRILVLGSFPSVKSREGQFFYHHPQNRFWRVLAAILDEPVPTSIVEKTAILHNHHIALWDVIGSCEIVGSSDSSIRNVVPNDLSCIFNHANIRAVFCNGTTSYNYYHRYAEPIIGRNAQKLPSTSPANASWSVEKLIEEWRQIVQWI